MAAPSRSWRTLGGPDCGLHVLGELSHWSQRRAQMPDTLLEQITADTELVLCFGKESGFSQHNWVLVLERTGNAATMRGLEGVTLYPNRRVRRYRSYQVGEPR